ncbi:MAG: hypothetical protein QM726_14940 [Chitinophagaceae bacterium]
MYAKKISIFVAASVICSSLLFTSCKKDNNQSTDNSNQISTQSDDQSRISAETDAVSNDVNTSLEASGSISGRMDGTIICDAAVVVDSISTPKKVTITYNGTNCAGNRTRTGVVVITLPVDKKWKDAGAAVTVSYQNLKITRLLDNKSITINGTHTITNVSGGLLYNLSNLPNGITHTIASSNMSVTFDDGSTRTWQVARQRQFNYNNGVVITETGTHSEGGKTGIEEWGTTRFGNSFTNAIITPLVVRQDCSWRLTSGVLQHTSVLATTTITFGLDATGAATSCPGNGSYYFKATWVGVGGKTVTIILPY